MPHYWFPIPLDTAPHLKKAKQEGGAPRVKWALQNDAAKRGKAVRDVSFAADMNSCKAELISAPDPLTPEECADFIKLWDCPRDTRCEPRLDADETVLEEGSGWVFTSGSA
jgi:hypothetical protein